MKFFQSPAVKVGLSISIATGLYGVSFGALSVTSGLDLWQTMALSLLLFSGGSQFAFIGVIGGGGTGVAAMTASALLGIRNGIYGMQMNALISPRSWRRPLAAQVTIDESTATAYRPGGPGRAAARFLDRRRGDLPALESVHRWWVRWPATRWGTRSSGAWTGPRSPLSWPCSGRA